MTENTLRSPNGGESYIQRRNLIEQVDVSEVTPLISGKAFEKARQEATAAGTLGAFYNRVYLSALHEYVQPGDEVWKYSTIETLSGDSGYCVVRGDTVIARHVVLMS
jgi:hypothetical protein